MTMNESFDESLDVIEEVHSKTCLASSFSLWIAMLTAGDHGAFFYFLGAVFRFLSADGSRAAISNPFTTDSRASISF